MCLYEGGLAQLQRSWFLQPRSQQPGWKFSHMNTPARLPGRNVFDKFSSLSQQGGKTGITLPCMYFYFRSIRISFISKVTRVAKATIVANDATFCCAILVLFLEFHTGRLCFLTSSRPAEISHMNIRQISPTAESGLMRWCDRKLGRKH